MEASQIMACEDLRKLKQNPRELWDFGLEARDYLSGVCSSSQVVGLQVWGPAGGPCDTWTLGVGDDFQCLPLRPWLAKGEGFSNNLGQKSQSLRIMTTCLT